MPRGTESGREAGRPARVEAELPGATRVGLAGVRAAAVEVMKPAEAVAAGPSGAAREGKRKGVEDEWIWVMGAG
eukprot:7150954-Prymnesium_polylepis.1